MSNGGPHGDKWNKYPMPNTSDDVFNLLNTPVEGKFATAAMSAQTGDGIYLYIANYGKVPKNVKVKAA